MDFFNSFRRLLGIPKRDNPHNFDDRFEQLWNDDRREPENHFFNDEDSMVFGVFSNPVEMHRYFEKQMNEFMKLFQFDDAQNFGHYSFSGTDPFNFPSIEDHQHVEQNSDNLRDQFLKPGYGYREPRRLRPKLGELYDDKYDTDIDEKFNSGDLDRLLKEKNSDERIQEVRPNVQFYGKSVQFKTVHHPDGRIETSKIVKDQDGNEEKTVTRKLGEKEHTIISRRDKEGREEITENMLNVDSNDFDQFWKKNEQQRLPPPDDRKPHNWFPLDKYFR